MPSVNAAFPGISQVLECTYTCSQGISPGVAQLKIVPQPSIPTRTGDLAFTDGINVITLRNFLVDAASIQANESGQITTLSLLDARWQWSTGTLYGLYNLRDPKEPNLTGKKSAQELAELAADEIPGLAGGYNVAAFPTDVYPEVKWGVTNPAKALAELADLFGLRLAYNPVLDRLVAWQAGAGAVELPVLPGTMSIDYTNNPPENPTGFVVVGSPNEYEINVLLEAVGKDVDGQWKPIDSLTYAPAGGWRKEHPLLFSSVGNGTTKENIEAARKLAQETVYRCYRIESVPRDVNQSVLDVDPFGVINFRDELRLLDHQTQFKTIQNDRGQDERVYYPPLVYGFFSTDSVGWRQNLDDADVTSDSVLPWWRHRTTLGSGATKDAAVVNVPFTIDRERCILTFQRQLFIIRPKTSESGAEYDKEIVPALLGLRIGAWIYDSNDNTPILYSRLDGTGPRWEIISAPHLYLQWSTPWNYTSDPDTAPDALKFNLPPWAGSLDEVNQEADVLIAKAKAKYQWARSGQARYAGIQSVIADGAISQWTYSISASGAFTDVGLNCEPDPYVPSHDERRFIERLNKPAGGADYV